jgi:hypothetical protein
LNATYTGYRVGFIGFLLLITAFELFVKFSNYLYIKNTSAALAILSIFLIAWPPVKKLWIFRICLAQLFAVFVVIRSLRYRGITKEEIPYDLAVLFSSYTKYMISFMLLVALAALALYAVSYLAAARRGG